MWAIEALDPELAKYLALGDAERTKQTWGEKKISINKEHLSTQAKTLFAAMCACSGRGEEETPGTGVCADMVKVIMAWRRGNLVPRWEVPALRALCKDFDPPDEYCG
jgi:hypothetical protein